jgi:multisite-specific tRNA:(cytosine-C5)-methyltransferase
MAYSFDDLGRLEMRKNPIFKDFHKFLVSETENGRIFRQEKVSMIPVTLLKIKPEHAILDMCAAPGSKTIQILEYLHAGGNKMNKGFVLANDTDMKRAYLLTHQARRLDSPSLFITCNDARFLPNLRINTKQQNLKFDRILCDVPCSGDGTFRKNMGLWKNFHAHMGHANHPLQLDILERGIKMLKKGGRIVYSTCTFNPIENEAVVAAALTRHMKQVKILDVSQEVSPFLRYRPGLTSWKVYHKAKGKNWPSEFYTKYDDVPECRRKVVKETMFTDTYTSFNNDEDRSESKDSDPLGLKNCMRFYPHDDNQGGFFVCVIEKIWDEDDGIIIDDGYTMDAWNNQNVRQKGIMEDLNDFVKDFEDIIKTEEEETGKKQYQPELSMMKEMIKTEDEDKT